MTSFTEKNILSSFNATGVSPLNPNVILDRFTNNSSDTSSEASSEASCYSGEDWRSLDRVTKRALSSASEKDAAIVRRSLHHMAIQNQLLQGENEGLRDALTYKKKGEARSKPLDLLQHYEYWGPNMLWTPRSFREAKTRLRLAQQERDAEDKKKTDMRELARAKKLYNEKIAEEKRAKRAREKEERDQRRAQERAEIDARKAQRQTDKEARDAQKAVQSSRRGKRKALQSAAPRKKQNRGGAAARSRRVAREPSPSPPATYSSRGRKIKPRKRLEYENSSHGSIEFSTRKIS